MKIDVSFDFTTDSPGYWDGFLDRYDGFGYGASDPDNNVNYSIVITGTYKDGDNNDWTITSSPIVGTESFSSLSTLQIGSGNATQWTVAGGAPVIPEPTTGLLVLLGVAGLALRRRRA